MHKGLRLTSGALACIISPVAHAEGPITPTPPAIADATPAPSAGTEVVVVAQRTDDHARKAQSAAPNLVNIQAAEAISKYPDVNAAEALSRVPGVALSVDTAEGRFINIRGLDGNLNGATFGGVVLLNTQPGGTYFNAAGRAVEFDTIPIGAIDRIVVTKTGLPDHDAEGLGGSVELTPRTALGLRRPSLDVTVGGGIETYRGTGLYRDEIVIGAPIGSNSQGDALASVILTQFLYNDRRTFDDIEGAYLNDESAGPDKAYAGLELRKYAYRRKRFGYSGEVDITPNDQHRLFARFSIAGYNEAANRNRLEIDSNGGPVLTDMTKPNALMDATASAVRTLRDYNESHRNSVYQIGGEHHFSDVAFDWFAAYSRASYDKHFDFNSTFDGSSGLLLTYDNTTNPNAPSFSATGADLNDTTVFNLSGISNAVEHDRDREWSFAGNATIPLHIANGDEVKIGLKLRRRRKSLGATNYGYSYDGASAPLSDFTSGQIVNDFYGGRYAIGALLNPAAIKGFLEKNPASFAATSRPGGYFDDTENVTAGYAQYHATFGNVGILGGVRVENTHVVYRGVTETIDASGSSTNDPTSVKRSYTDLFPTLQIRYQFTPDLVARATYSTGIARPGFYQTIQSKSVDVGAGIVTTGNPDLKPTTANSFDLALEYYLPAGGILSIGLFDKELRNFVVARTNRTSSYPGIDGIALVQTFGNVPAHVRGVEASASYKLHSGSLLDGFGMDANGSVVESGAAVRPGETVSLPGTFSSTVNLALFYERGRGKIRISGQRESAVLFGVGDSRARDIFQNARTTLDLNASYKLNEAASLYLNAKNLTNSPLRFYEGSSDRPIQREFYEATFEGGLKVHF